VQVKTSYLNQPKNEIAKARGAKEDALPIAEETLGPLCKAAESGSLNDWLAYYQAFDNAGLKSDLPKDKIPSLSFWSGKSANNVNASEMAKQFSDSGVGLATLTRSRSTAPRLLPVPLLPCQDQPG